MALDPHVIAYALAAMCLTVCVLYVTISMQTDEEWDIIVALMWLVGALVYLLIAI